MEIDFELLFFTLVDSAENWIYDLFSWIELLKFCLENFLFKWVFFNFFWARWDGFHEILNFFVAGFNVLVVEVALEAAFKWTWTVFLGSWDWAHWFFPRGRCVDKVGILRIEVGVFLCLKWDVLVKSIILAEIKVGEVEKWWSHSLGCFLILFEKLYNTHAIISQ